METKTSRKKSLKMKKATNSKNSQGKKQAVPSVSDQTACPQSAEKHHACDDHKHSNLKEKIQHFVGLHTDAPDYLKDNDYIISGYRINFSSPKKVLQSLFIKHNESYNVWSHLLGSIFVIFLMVVLFFQVMPSAGHAYLGNDANCTNSTCSDRFSAILNQLPDLSSLELAVKDNIEENKKDFRQFKETYRQELEAKLNNAVEITEKFALKDATPNTIKTFAEKLEAQVLDIAQSFKLWEEKLGSALADTVVVMNLKKTSKLLNQKLDEVRASISQSIIEKFDSEQYDWVDIYKYIDHRDHSHPTPNNVHRWPLFVALFSAAFCLLGSSVFHLAYCMSPRVNTIVMRLDYAGISVLITGSCFPPFVYGFYCQPTTATFYLTLLSVCSIAVFCV
jgi:adiponectin receptor